MKSIRLLCVLLALSPFTLIGCGDDSDSNGGSADAKAYVTSCENLCAAQDAKKCDNGGFTMSLADCKSLCQVFAGVTGDCAAKFKAYGQCTDNASDACTAETACSSQQEAATNACPKG